MPKIKIKKSVSRRFKVTPRGKVLHRTAFGGHLKANKSKSQIRKYKKLKPITTKFSRNIKRLLGK